MKFQSFLLLALLLSATAQDGSAPSEPEAEPEPAVGSAPDPDADQAAVAEPEVEPSDVSDADAGTEASTTTTTTTTSSSISTEDSSDTPPPTTTTLPPSLSLPLVTPLPSQFDPKFESVGGATLYNVTNIYSVLTDIATIKPLEDIVSAALPPKPKIDKDAFSTRTLVYKFINVLNIYQAAHTFCHRERFQLFGPTTYDSLQKMQAFSPTTIWVNITQDFKSTPGVTGVFTYADGTPVPHVFYHRPSNWSQKVLFDASLNDNQRCAVFDFSIFTFRAEECEKRHEFFCFGRSTYGVDHKLYLESTEQANIALSESRRLANLSTHLIVDVNRTIFSIPWIKCHAHEPKHSFDLPVLKGLTLPSILSHLIFRNHRAAVILNFIKSLTDYSDQEDVKMLGLSQRDELCLAIAKDPLKFDDVVVIAFFTLIMTIIATITSVYAAIHKYCPGLLRKNQPPTAIPMQERRGSINSILRQSPSTRRLQRSISFSEGVAPSPSAPPPYNPSYPGPSDRFLETRLWVARPIPGASSDSISSLSSSE